MSQNSACRKMVLPKYYAGTYWLSLRLITICNCAWRLTVAVSRHCRTYPEMYFEFLGWCPHAAKIYPNDAQNILAECQLKPSLQTVPNCSSPVCLFITVAVNRPSSSAFVSVALNLWLSKVARPNSQTLSERIRQIFHYRRLDDLSLCPKRG